ncbi:MAG TPA: hypothetical protein VLK84_02640 [Longimicrobium sp.]|nr:hypothetical protein [Longimicrobium sp.]
MPTIRPFHLPALLLATALAAAPAAGQNGAVAVDASHLRTLQARLDSVASALSPQERAAWDRLLLRAASAPAPSSEVRVTPVLEIGPGGGCDGGSGMDDATNRVAIIVQGGRTAGNGIIVQGGRTPSREGIIVQGRTPAGATQGANAPRPNPAGTVAIGPKQDDPSRPGRVRAGAVAIGPKQDDPAPPPQGLGRRIADLAARISPEERGALNWLLTRASAEVQPARVGGLPPGPCNPETGCRAPTGGTPQVSLRQALGIDMLAIGPKQDDPAPPPPAQRWMLRY